MVARFDIIATSSFSRSLKKMVRKSPEVAEVYQAALEVLQHDPFNLSRRHNIKKLVNVEVGDGQWRIRSGVYRLRYDIEGERVILHSINHRKEAY